MRKPPSPRVVSIVDADASVREGLSRLMDAAGLEARSYASVSGLLEGDHWLRVACVLLDVSSLRTCDAAASTALRAIARVLPVIALSAADDAAASRLAQELGARSFFRKPVDAAALLDAIEWAMLNHGRATHA